MKIIFYNLNDGRNDKEGVLKYILDNKDSTDVFCLQEMGHRISNEVTEVLSDFTLFYKSKTVTEDDIFYQATFINKKCNLLDTQEVLVEHPKIGMGTYTKISIKDKVFNLINFHGLSRPGDKLDTSERLAQTNGIIDFCSNLEGPTIIGGDFNYNNDIESVKLFEKSGYIDLIKKHNITNTRNENVWKKYPDSKLYYSDFIFTTPDVNVLSLEVPYNEYSDHLPMILTIDL